MSLKGIMSTYNPFEIVNKINNSILNCMLVWIVECLDLIKACTMLKFLVSLFKRQG